MVKVQVYFYKNNFGRYDTLKNKINSRYYQKTYEIDSIQPILKLNVNNVCILNIPSLTQNSVLKFP